MKKILTTLLLILISSLHTAPVQAGPSSVVDQACFPGSGEYGRMWLNQHENIVQLFTPTQNTLHMVTLGLGTTFSSAKARVKVINFTEGNVDVIAQKYITVTEDKYYQIDFGSVPLTGQYYGLKVEMANQNEPFYWNAIGSINGECNPGGIAMIGDMTTEGEIDMIFAIRTYNTPVTNSATDTSGSSTAEQAIPEPPNNDPTTSPSNTTTTVDESTTNAVDESTTNQDYSTTNVLEPSTTQPTNDVSVAGDTSKANILNENGKKLTADKELQESIALLLKDLEQNKYRNGAFGLQGRVGRILTWPVFYGISGLIILLVLLMIIKSIKRRRADKTKDDQKVLHDVEKSTEPPKKKGKGGCIVIIFIIFLLFGINFGYRLYLASLFNEDYPTSNIDDLVDAQIANSETDNSVATTTNKDTSSSSSKNSSENLSSTTPTTAPENSSTTTPSSSVLSSSEEQMLDYFIDIALPSPITIERWVKNPFNVGFGPDTLDLRESTCVDGFIRDFNNASSTTKLYKDRREADIKIYKVTPEEMAQYGGEDAGWAVSYGYKNSANERTKGEIFVSTDVPNNDNVKCYLMRHEMMHNVGFRGHSDRFSDGIMAVPSLDRNTDNIMSEVDKKAIQMLYNTGLPLKSTKEEAREYLTNHFPR